jgi:lipopolysaccharide export system protein LptC
MRREPRTRSLLDRMTAWSPVLLLGGLAALTYWLDAQVQGPPPRRDGTARHDPDLFAERFRAVKLDEKGRMVQSLSGRRVDRFADDQSTVIASPQMTQTDVDKPGFAITADSASVTSDREDVYFTGNVVARREAVPAQPGRDGSGAITVKTEYLHAIPNQRQVRTDKPVTIEEARGIINSVGLELDDNAKTVKFKSGVRGTFQSQVPSK